MSEVAISSCKVLILNPTWVEGWFEQRREMVLDFSRISLHRMDGRRPRSEGEN